MMTLEAREQAPHISHHGRYIQNTDILATTLALALLPDAPAGHMVAWLHYFAATEP
jgi:hypothetical protein